MAMMVEVKPNIMKIDDVWVGWKVSSWVYGRWNWKVVKLIALGCGDGC